MVCIWKFQEELRKTKHLEFTIKELQKMYSSTKAQGFSFNSFALKKLKGTLDKKLASYKT